MSRLSPRLTAIVDGLPVRPGDRVLELGSGPGAAARELAIRGVAAHVLATDRSAAAVRQAASAAQDPACEGRLAVRQVAAEAFELEPDEAPFDLVFAVRVGALDGRHPELARLVRTRVIAATTDGARLFVDGVERALRT